MSTHEFNIELLTAWVALCDKEGEMRREGASVEEIAVVQELIKIALAVLVQTSSVREVQVPPEDVGDPD